MSQQTKLSLASWHISVYAYFRIMLVSWFHVTFTFLFTDFKWNEEKKKTKHRQSPGSCILLVN